MKNAAFRILIVFLNFIFLGLNAQTLNNQQRREINEAVLSFIDDYGKYSTFTLNYNGISDNYVNSFLSLFAEDAFIYNDITPSNKVSDEVKPTDYVELFKDYYFNGIGIKLRDILFETPTILSDEKYTMVIDLLKEGYGFSKTNVYYRDTIPLTLTIGFDYDTTGVRNLKIENIQGPPMGRFVKFRILKMITHKPLENARVALDSDIERTDNEGLAFFSNIDPNQTHSLRISFDDYKPIVKSNLKIDRLIEENSDRFHRRLKLDYYDPNEIIFQLSPFNFSVTALFSFALPGFKTITSLYQNEDLEFDNLRIRSSASPRLGLLAGMTAFRYGPVNVSVKAGVEKSFISGAYLFDNYHLEYPDVDDNSDYYTRMIDLYDHKQRITLRMTEFPILISVIYKGLFDLDVGGTFGIRFSTLNKSSCLIKSGYSISGEYPQYDTVYTADYHDFKDIKIRERSIFPSERKFFGYQIGLTFGKEIMPSVRAFAGPTVILYNKEFKSNTSVSDILTSDEEVNNILDTYKVSRMKYISLEFGLVYNFNTINLNKIL